MAPEQQRLSAAERENLVAYLDGELNEAETHAIEAKLTASISARREVEALEQTWELLDFLPRPQASAEMSTRTLSRAGRMASPDDRLLDVARRTTRRLGPALAGAALVLVGLGIGYVSTRWLWPNPTARLVRDLSLAEQLDEYQSVGSFDFLQQLDESGIFDTDTN
ncbi:MAG TPA: hypothetical protein VF590_20885 [Isosphaeraceae bacterium]|jgi:anti-sigma factor RsiW